MMNLCTLYSIDIVDNLKTEESEYSYSDERIDDAGGAVDDIADESMKTEDTISVDEIEQFTISEVTISLEIKEEVSDDVV